MAVAFPEQIEFEAAVAINVGLGVTKTVTIKGALFEETKAELTNDLINFH